MENDEAPNTMQIASLTATIEQLARKRTVLNELNEKLLAIIKDPDELEEEIMQAEDIECEINEKSAQISAFILSRKSVKNTETLQVSAPPTSISMPPQQVSAPQASISQPQQASTSQPQASISNSQPQQASTSQPQASASQSTTSPTIEGNTQQNSPINQELATIVNETEGVSLTNQTDNNGESLINSHTLNPTSPTAQAHLTPTSSHMSRLPKLNLPTFSGNPLNWNTFWDSFNVAVNSNPNLEGVQKFNYLRAQLSGDASRAIAGFPLTNNNYKQAVDLLKARFGEPQKIINNHTQALLNLPNPTNDITSLQQFYDSMETHVRGLASLGKSQESYGDLLVPIIIGKLPNNLRRNLAREHNNLEWTFTQLRNAISKEIKILEAGIYDSENRMTPEDHQASITSSFLSYSQYGKPPPLPPLRQVPPTLPKQKKCVYCKKPHSSNECTTIKDSAKRWAIVKEHKLCFNCLGHHKSSACQSKFRCRTCKGKHHIRLCTGGLPKSDPPARDANKAENPPGTVVHTTMTPIAHLSIPSNTVTLLNSYSNSWQSDHLL